MLQSLFRKCGKYFEVKGKICHNKTIWDNYGQHLYPSFSVSLFVVHGWDSTAKTILNPFFTQLCHSEFSGSLTFGAGPVCHCVDVSTFTFIFFCCVVLFIHNHNKNTGYTLKPMYPETLLTSLVKARG